MITLPEWFLSLSPLTQAFTAGLFTWGMTALGASLVFFTKKINYTLLDKLLLNIYANTIQIIRPEEQRTNL